jgi:hypothetical protein
MYKFFPIRDKQININNQFSKSKQESITPSLHPSGAFCNLSFNAQGYLLSPSANTRSIVRFSRFVPFTLTFTLSPKVIILLFLFPMIL